MAETKTVNLEVNSNLDQTEKAVTSLKTELRKAQQEVASLSDKFGATSKEAIEAAKRAADLKDRIGDAKSLTDAFNPDAKFKSLTSSLSGAAGGLSAVTGAMGLLGGESKDVEQAILKVQSAMAISQGVQAVGESVDAFKQLGAVVKSYSIVQKAITAGQWLWNAAMAANPIGAIVAVVVALVAAGYALVNMFIASSEATMKAEVANKALNKELDTQVKNQKLATQEADLSRDAQLKMAKASGKSAAEIRKLSVELANQEVAQKMANAQTLRAIAIEAIRVAGLEDATDAQKETAKRALKEFNDANDALKTSVLNRRKLLIDNKVAETQEQTDATKKANDAAKAKRDEATKKELDDIKKANEDKLAEEKRLRDERRKLFEDAIKAADDLEKSLRESVETPAQKENREYLEKKKILEDNYRSTEILDKQHKENLQNIENEAFALDAEKAIERTEAQKVIDDKKAADDAEREKLRDEAIASSKQNLQNIISGLEASGIAKSKAGQAISKALALTQIGIDSAVAISKASTLANAEGVAAQLAFPTVPGIGTIARVTSYASTALSVISNIVRAKQLLSGGGGGGSSSGGGRGTAPTGGGGGGAAPQFNVVGNSGVNQLAQTLGGNSEQAPIQAYVVASNVTSAQSLNRNIVNNASLG